MNMKSIIALLPLFMLLFPSGIHGAVPVNIESMPLPTQQETYPNLLGEDLIDQDLLDDAPVDPVSDPLEPVNRVFFKFNDVLYEWVLKPVTDGYSWVLPVELRECFGNVFLNLATPIRFINSLLQGNIEQAGIVLQRFLINSTAGVWGFKDIADEEFGIKRRRADFGQTLGKWGMGPGMYICWPVLGPSSVRGSVGLVADSYMHPIQYIHDSNPSVIPFLQSGNGSDLDMAYNLHERINYLSLHPEIYEDVKKYSVDPYVAVRQGYYDYRKSLVDQQ